MSRVWQAVGSLFAAKPRESPSEWAARCLTLPAPYDVNGSRINLDLGPFIREPLDWYSEIGQTELALCFGSQAGKTLILTAGRAWVMAHKPCVFGVMWPVTAKVEEYADTRWRPMCEQSPAMDAIRRRGKSDWKILSQKFNAGQTLFYGSNSPAMLASTPMQWVEIDEGDKCADATKKEASSAELFPNRIKRSDNGRIVRASTPSTIDGFIWKYFLAGDQRRWHVPCPCCGKDVTFCFDPTQTQLPILGNETTVVFDHCKDDGEWNLDRVMRETFMQCPHNGCTIRDSDKTEMNRKGRWVATNPAAARGRRSYHLSSLYVPGNKTSFGAIAVAFLEGKRDGSLQDLVNGMLAEPFASQTGEVPFRPESAEYAGDKATSWLQMTVDVQLDHEWCLVARVDMAGNMQVIHAEKTHGWGDVRALQLRYALPDWMVWIDSGGSNQARVYAACMDYGKPITLPGRNLPVHMGWSPCRGEPKKYFHDALNQGARSVWHFKYVDPYAGHTLGMGGKMHVPLYEIATHGAKDIFDDLRNGRLKTAKFEVANDLAGNVGKPDLWKHLEGEIKVQAFVQNRMTWIWKLKSRKTPNHLLDCCIYQLAMQQHQKRIRQQLIQPPAANESRQVISVKR